MNKRLKELAMQAETKEIGYYFFDREKFAKLIVQKCLDIVEGEDDCGPDTKSVRLAMLRIKEHFGIES